MIKAFTSLLFSSALVRDGIYNISCSSFQQDLDNKTIYYCAENCNWCQKDLGRLIVFGVCLHFVLDNV